VRPVFFPYWVLEDRWLPGGEWFCGPFLFCPNPPGRTVFFLRGSVTVDPLLGLLVRAIVPQCSFGPPKAGGRFGQGPPRVSPVKWARWAVGFSCSYIPLSAGFVWVLFVFR